MERSLLSGTLVLGALGWVVGVLLTRGRSGTHAGRPVALFVSAAVIALVAVAAITVPERPVWPAGQPWGRGVLLGGVASLLAAWVLLGVGRETPTGVRALPGAGRIAAPLFAGLIPVAATLLWFGATVVDTAVGVATGWFMVSLLMTAGIPVSNFTAGGTRGTGRHSQADPGYAADGPDAALLMTTGFVVTLCATVALGHYRDAGGGTARWMISAMMLAAGVAVLSLIAAIVSPSGARDNAKASTPGTAMLRMALPALLFVGLAYVVGGSFLGQPRLTAVAATGLVTALLAWWMATEPDTDPPGTREFDGGPSVAHVLAILIGLGGVVAAFYLLVGYGIGAMLIAGWLPVALILMHRDRSGSARLVQVLIFGVILLLYRVLTQRLQDDLSGATLVDHFALFSIIAGIALPLLLSGLLGRPGLRGPDVGGPEHQAPAGAGSLGRVVAAVLIAIAVPAAMLVLWGPRAAIGLLTGLALASVLYAGAVSLGWMALLAALPMVQWASQALRLALLTRDERMYLLLILAAVIAVLILLADIGARVTARLRRRGRPSLASEAREGAHP